MLTLKLIISFITGGLFIALQTIIGERVSMRWRGVVLTIPSTMAVSILFISITKSPNDIIEVARVLPAGLGACFLFATIFALLSRYSLILSLVGGLAGWAAGAAWLLYYPPATFWSSLFIYNLPIALAGYLITRRLPQKEELTPLAFTPLRLVVRAVFAGSVVCSAVALANTLGNTWGGLFSAFPAVFTSTFVLYYLAHGKEVMPAVIRSIYFPGDFTMVIFTYVAGVTFPLWGTTLGLIAAYAASAVFTIIVQWLRPKPKPLLTAPGAA
ncbi:hypothetical protein CO046_03685 [Candidatus Peregrinibacteria bacterium CG_4_9_14_0_2_um_filter_53_11]|nr:MAG: hypothetical protein CO046_03685 [Candidatus Peregrinibacteria bacterium CG_4_9_14_0_2_um_filter_53_11]